jgi:hypothetical protein
MSAAARLAAFGVGLVGVFGVAAAVGAAVGPIDVGGEDHLPTTVAGSSDEGLTGMVDEANGLRLVPAINGVDAATVETYSFTIERPDGRPLTDVAVTHERPLHLVLVSRNLVDFHHLHPELAESGTWSVTLPALAAGSYRVYADLQPTGADPVTLATDLDVRGAESDVALPAPESASEVDGYVVERQGSVLRPGEAEVAFDVRVDGQTVVTDPYLGAAGHLVAIRAADMGYLHVHPLEVEPGSSQIRFAATFPTSGTYRLFLDFAHGGEIHTASFTLDVPAADVGTAGSEPASHGGHG